MWLTSLGGYAIFTVLGDGERMKDAFVVVLDEIAFDKKGCGGFLDRILRRKR